MVFNEPLLIFMWWSYGMQNCPIMLVDHIQGLSRRYPAKYMKNRDIYWRRYKIQEKLYIGQWRLSPLQSRYLGTSHCSLILHGLSCLIFLNLINSLKSLPFQRWFYFWEKPEVTGHQIWAVGGLSHLGDLMFCKKNSAWDVMYEWVCCHDDESPK